MPTPIKIGFSACLLGHPVRYDGGHKHDHYITDTREQLFCLVAVCPEVGCGMPTQREATRLEGEPAIRKNCIDLVFSYRRWKDFLK